MGKVNQHSVKPYTEDEVNEILNLYGNGVCHSNIAYRLSRKKSNIKKLLIDKGVWVEGKFDKEVNFSEEEIETIKDMYINDGLSCRKIGSEFNVSRTPIEKLLKNEGLLRNGNSDGKRIELTNNQKKEIVSLYINENKSSPSIANKLGFSEGFINKFLNKKGVMRTKGEGISLVKKGVKLPYSTKLNMKKAQQKLAKSGRRKQTGGYCKFYYVNGIKCQGTYEKWYLEYLLNNDFGLPCSANIVDTPYGVYYPDFEFNDRLIEIKSDYTYRVLIGEKRNKFTNDFDTNQYDKILWTTENIKPVEILIVDKKNNALIKK